MTSKQILILCILVSIVSHTVIIFLTGLIYMKGISRAAEIITVDLKELEKYPSPEEQKAKEETTQSMTSARRFPEKKNDIKRHGEETVDLNSRDTRFSPYLKVIKKRIERLWALSGYPSEARDEKEEGDAVVQFTIDASGALLENNILETSGSEYLDHGALNVVKNSGPYDPLPESLGLTKLRIVATFQYRLIDLQTTAK